MRRLFYIVGTAVLLLNLACPNREVEVKITLTNPNSKAIPFNGFYKLSADPNNVTMKDYTPKEYIFTLEKGQTTSGEIYKDSLDTVEILRFQLFIDGAQKPSQDLIYPGILQKYVWQAGFE